MLTIPPTIVKQMQDHALACYPKECCGILFAKNGSDQAVRCVTLENMADKLHAFDPATGEGWEGVGVQPDVPVPAKDALQVTLQRVDGAAAVTLQTHVLNADGRTGGPLDGAPRARRCHGVGVDRPGLSRRLDLRQHVAQLGDVAVVMGKRHVGQVDQRRLPVFQGDVQAARQKEIADGAKPLRALRMAAAHVMTGAFGVAVIGGCHACLVLRFRVRCAA